MTSSQNIIEHEDEISQLFKNAIIKIDERDKQAKKEKKNIVKDLARDLEGKIRLETICIEIVNQLRGRVSERFIRECLEDKYKQQFTAENAKRQKIHDKAEKGNENLAALAPLKKQQQEEHVKRTEQIISVQSGQAGAIEGIEETQLALASTTTQEANIDNKVAGQNRPDDGKEYPSCKEKDFANHELAEALSRQTTLVSAEKISLQETEFRIPKEKYLHLIYAMKKSKDSFFIRFDESGVFERAIPDTLIREQTCA
jgi:hypothetical protein